MKIHRAIAAAALGALLLSASPSQAQTATLAWDAVPDSSVTGYRVYYGTQSHVYPSIVDVGNVTTHTVGGLDLSKDYYFAVQAYADNLASELSNEVKLPAPIPPGTTVITSFTANTAYPLLVGKPVTWTAWAASKRGAVEYQFWMLTNGTWSTVQPFSAQNKFTWTPGWNDLGPHTLQVWARTAGSPASYEAWVATPTFTVNASPIQLTSNTEFPVPPSTQVTWTAAVAGASGVTLEYKFWVFNPATASWSPFRDWNPSNRAVWTPADEGNYSVQVWVRRVGAAVNYDTYAGASNARIARSPLQVTDLKADRTFPATTGTEITWTAKTKGGQEAPIEYQFWRYNAGTGWQSVQGYSTSNTYTWTPTWGDDGDYAIQVWARSNGSTANYEAWKGTATFTITQAPLQLSTTTVFPVPPGTPTQWLAEVGDPGASVEYQFWLYRQGTGVWSVAQPYSASKTFLWTPSAADTYAVQAWARRVGSTEAYDAWRGSDYLRVTQTPATLKSLTANVALPAPSGASMTWTAVGAGGSAAPLLYRFLLFDGASWSVGKEWSSASTWTWTPPAAGTYAVQVWVKSTGSTTATYEAWLGSGTFTITP